MDSDLFLSGDSVWWWGLYFLAVIAFCAVVAFAFISSISATPPPAPASRSDLDNVLLVIAHPDDEAMFFVPSMLHLRRHFNVHVLCLSNGAWLPCAA